MGIGAKIKEALHSDKETSHDSSNTHQTPGSYPSETVPRTNDKTSTHGSQGLNTTSGTRTGNSGDYTYGSNTGPTSHTGTIGQHKEAAHGLHGSKAASNADPRIEPGSTGLGHTTHQTGTGTSGGYAAGTTGEGVSGPHGSRVGNTLDPRIDSDRDHRGAPGSGLGHNTHSTTTNTSTTTGTHTGPSGATGAPGNYSGSEGAYGPHSSRVGNSLDPRVDSDRDHRGATVGTNAHHGPTGTSTHNKLTKEAKDPYWGDSHRAGINEPGSHIGAHDRSGHSLDSRQVNDEYNRTGGGHDYDPYRHDSSGATSNLPHRPVESKVTPRDRKIQEYDAPTASSDYQGHGLGATGAGLAGGAAAGFGASKLADRHHEQDLRENDPSYGSHHHSGSRGNDVYGNTGSRERTSGAGLGLNDPHAVNTATQPGTGAGTSMLDPYGTSTVSGTSGVHAPGRGHTQNTTAGHREGENGPHNSRVANSLDPRVDSDRDHRGAPTGSSTVIPSGSNYDNSYDHGHGGQHGAGGDSHLRLRDSSDHSNNAAGPWSSGTQDKHSGIGGSGYDHENPSQGASSGAGPGHFGPSHPGAKVFHKCHNCGTDNDISKHFSKDAVYRLG
ncbi:hypothetical protein BKA67DRAFT_431853 [Truncatella angustata]|uniref:Cell surface protein n=1 Tax=Truncatella angustata TaxID=152316 RepID=A0A9P8RN75_9PEZI|nr:uncharacterized protein BKA67DRAFT_431853 [Truncatella angustata]KAH6647293.1 hypothetical protein BKA67DRAFT_431853 [Truncatella angustata]